jgi:hypothetical protein
MFVTTASATSALVVANAKVIAATSGVSFTYQMPTGTTASGTITSFTAYKSLQFLGGGLTRFQQTTGDAGAIASGSLILGNNTGLNNIGTANLVIPADGELVWNTVVASPKYTGGGNIYQSATNVLRTSGNFDIGGTLSVDGGSLEVGVNGSTAGLILVRGDNTTGGRVALYSGSGSTGGTIAWDITNSRFSMNNDLNIAGTLTGVTTLTTSSTVTSGGVLNANSSASVGLKVINGIAVGAVDGIYWGVDTTGPNLFYSSGWRFSQTTAAASTVDAVFNGASSTATSQTLVRVSSSERYKENISFLDFPLHEIVKLQPAEYQYREEWRGKDDDGNPLPAQTQVGIIAESATSNSVWNKLVVNDGDGRPDSWRYSLMGPVLLSAVRQLNDKITALEAKIAALEGA